MRMTGPGFTAVTVLIYVFILLPILIVVLTSVSPLPYLSFPPAGFSLRWYKEFVSSTEFLRATVVSLEVAALSTLLVLVLGTSAAFALSRDGVKGRDVILQFLTSPLILPSVVMGLGLLQFYALLNADPALWTLVMGHAVITLPYVVRSVYASLLTYDRRLDEAAATLGARPWRVFWKVTLPEVKSGLIGGGVFAFVISFGNINVSAFLIGPATTTLPVRVYNYIEFSNDPTVAAVSTLVILATFGAVWLLERTVGLGGLLR